MKIKIIFHHLLFSVLAMVATGCCTGKLTDYYRERTTDCFFPAAVYQSTNTSCFAPEGNFHKQQWSPMHIRDIDREPPIHSYLIIPQIKLGIQSGQTNGVLLAMQLKKISSRKVTRYNIESTLPSDFERVAELPINDISLIVNETRPHQAAIVLIPAAIAVDIVFSPLYLIGICALGNGF